MAVFTINFKGVAPFNPGRTVHWEPATGALHLPAAGNLPAVDITLEVCKGTVRHYLGKAQNGAFHLLLLEEPPLNFNDYLLIGKVQSDDVGGESGVWGAEAGGDGGD